MTGALPRWLTLAILTLATVAVSHDLIYVLAHGPGAGYAAAMEAGGHSSYWASFVLSATVLSAVLAGVAGWQLRRLARAAGPRPAPSAGSPRHLARLVGARWRTLTFASVGWFLLLENLERLAHGDQAVLLGAVAGDQWLAIPILALVSLAVAFVAGLVAWRRETLLARLARPRQWPRRYAATPRIDHLAPPRRLFLSAGEGLRAPPAGSALT